MLSLALLVWAEPAPVDLRWSGVCEAPELVLERLDDELLATEDPSRWVPVAAEVQASAAEAGVSATVSLTTGTGETRRTLEAVDCAELQQAVALLLAIHVYPFGEEAATSAKEPGPEPEPEPEASEPVEPLIAEPEPLIAEPAPAPVFVDPAEQRPPPPRQPPPDRGQGSIQAGVGLTAGVLPNAAPSFELGGGWTRGHLLLGARASYLPPQSDTRGAGTITLQSWDVALRGCGVVFAGPVNVPLCGIAGVGAVHGGARGFDESGTSARGMAYTTGSVGIDWPVAPRFVFWARIEGGGTLWRPRFEVQGIGQVYVARVWRAGAAIGVRFDFL